MVPLKSLMNAYSLDDVLGADGLVAYHAMYGFCKDVGYAQLLHLVALLAVRNAVGKDHFFQL